MNLGLRGSVFAMEDSARPQLKRGGLDLLDPCFIGSGGPGRGLGTQRNIKSVVKI